MSSHDRRYSSPRAPGVTRIPSGGWPTPLAAWLAAVVASGAMDEHSGLLLRDVTRPDGTVERREAVRTRRGLMVLDPMKREHRQALRDWRGAL